METTFLIIVGVLIILAATDLIVGVSNDAVNFLNSAIGAKVAPRRVIMLVAAAGIFLGATFSSGMMEIARKGIFNPEFFMFSDIMMIFLAVMLADIILLDLFNSLGLPTSTTVSIVFELLGAAVVLAFMKTIDESASIAEVGKYINSSKAIAIIVGILLSVFIAFTVGAIVQFLSRWLLTFHYDKRMKYFGGLWTGLAMSAITYFLLLKGLKGASFVTDEFISWIKSNSILILIYSFLGWSVILQICISIFKVKVLKFVVLFGTFSLAMAFAGNDLVNFVGVPLAGLESFLYWKSTGADPYTLSMEMLTQPVRANTVYLLIAGGIMAGTLFLSRKARKVTDTQVNLSRQEEYDERFSPNLLARWLVRGVSATTNYSNKLLPGILKKGLSKNFDSNGSKSDDPEVAFDLIRASVNLTVASALIAIGTSLKLPLSTTYVSFMVAMGTSLTDKAWGRESAVYRVAGVLNVIGGWFATALVAFIMAGTFVFVMKLFGFNAGFALMVIAAAVIIRGFVRFRNKERSAHSEGMLKMQRLTEISKEEFIQSVLGAMSSSSKAFTEAVNGLIREDVGSFASAFDEVDELKRSFQRAEIELFRVIRKTEEDKLDERADLLYIFGKVQDIIQSTEDILIICRDHIINNHKPPSQSQAERLNRLLEILDQKTLKSTSLVNSDEEDADFNNELSKILKLQFHGIYDGKFGKKNSSLIFRLVSESRDFNNSMTMLANLLKSL